MPYIAAGAKDALLVVEAGEHAEEFESKEGQPTVRGLGGRV